MKRPIHDYDYEDLKIRALASDATKEDRLALLNWFDLYGWSFWNGEYYEIDDPINIRPVYETNPDDEDDLILVDAEIRLY